MRTRFRVDLLHPGEDLRHVGWVGQGGGQWFVGDNGPRRLGLFTLACVAILVILVVALIMPPYLRLSRDLSALPGLRQDLAARDADLNVVRSNIAGLTEEARRQIRWGEFLTTLSQQIPPTLKLSLVDAGRGGSAAGAPAASQPGAPVRAESTIRVDALTPVRPGSPPLLEVAQFMAGLTRDPGVSKRFQLKSWEIKPSSSGEGQFLDIDIRLSERPQ